MLLNAIVPTYCPQPDLLSTQTITWSSPAQIVKGGVSLLHAWMNVSPPFNLERPLSLRKKRIKYPQNIFYSAST